MMGQPAGPYILYYLGFGEDQRPAYVGITRISIRRRLSSHRSAARNPADRAEHPVAARIHREEQQGKPVWLKVLMEGLTEGAAKEQEVNVIRGLLRAGIALENRELRGEHGVPIRYPHGTPEFNAAKREHAREYGRKHQANDPAYRTRHIARNALWQLGQGRPVTPRRVEVITLAGRVEEARAILATRGETWPEVDPA